MSQIDNVTFITPQAPGGNPAGSSLLQRVRDVGLNASGALFKHALDALDDALFGFSEKSETAAARGQFMDAMRNVRLKRPAIEQAFREEIANHFMEFTRLRGLVPSAGSRAIESDTLSLVEENDLEEDLAINGMAAKARIRHNSALYALNQRLAVVVGAKEVNDEANPLGPPAVCEGLKAAMRQIEADITVKLVILKLFDRHVVNDLDQVYDDTNRALAEAGVLPNIKYTRPARAPGEAPPPKSAAAGTDSAASAAHLDPDEAAATNEVMSAIATFFASRRQAAHGGELPRPSGPSISNADLIAALSRLQAEAPRGDALAFDLLSPSDRVERVKQDLIEQLRQRGVTQPDQRVATADEDAIDLVGMLFQYVVQDRNLPADVQAILSRLQIPYVRVAIKDKHLFAQKVHPARKLLNTLAMASVTWSKEADRDSKFLNELNKTVERVVGEYADDFSLFSILNAEFEAVLERQKKHSEVAEQRATEAASGREKLSQARHLVNQMVQQRIGGRPLPPLARELVLNPWTNFLVLTHLRQGPESVEWKSAVNFIDAVVWSSQPKTEEKDRVRLQGLLPQMQAFLRRGLNVVGFGESDAEGLVKGFGALFQSIHQHDVSLESASTVAEAERALEAVKAQPTPDTAKTDAPSGGEATLPESDPYLIQVRAMKVGTWIEFVNDANARERAKLSWISPFSARFLFVNRKGLKVAERSVFALANELRAGTACLLEVSPIFDRALDSIMNRLKDEHQQAGGAKPDPAARP